jgi:hypothetical protein
VDYAISLQILTSCKETPNKNQVKTRLAFPGNQATFFHIIIFQEEIMKRIVTFIVLFSAACLIILSQEAMFIDNNGKAEFYGDVEVQGNLTVAGVDNAYMPSGGIIMWAGTIAEIPEGWALCDGENGTPDLRDRFILSVAGPEEDPGKTGGSHFLELTIDNMPSHDHGGRMVTENLKMQETISIPIIDRMGVMPLLLVG